MPPEPPDPVRKSTDTYSAASPEFYPLFDTASSWPAVIAIATTAVAAQFSTAAARAAASLAPAIDMTRVASAVITIRQSGLDSLITRALADNRSHVVQPFFNPVLNPFTLNCLRSIADGTNRVLYHGFVPNMGLDATPLPDALVPGAAVAAHLAADQRLGRIIIVPLVDFIAACTAENRQFHLNRPHLAAKPERPLGRLVIPFRGVNSPDKKELLAARWGPLRDPQFADLCQLLANAVAFFPGQDILCGKCDVDAAYKHIPHCAADVANLAIPFVVDHIDYVALPLCCHFGLQDSNYQFGVVTRTLRQLSWHRTSRYCPGPISDVITDDFICFGPRHVIDAEDIATATSMQHLLGPASVSSDKRTSGPRLTIGGFLFDCPTRRVHLSQKALITLIALFFAEIPESPTRSLATLFMRLSSLAIRNANILTPLLPFSRSFTLPLLSSSSDSTVWPRQALVALFFWREALRLSVTHPAWLSVSIYRPLLYRRAYRDEPNSFRESRQLALADLVIYADACQDTRFQGIGVFCPNRFWASIDVSHLTHYMDYNGSPVPMHINVLEFLAVLLAVLITTAQLGPSALCGLHVHVRSDNMSALAWLRRQRDSSPLHSSLLLSFSLLQVRFAFHLTEGFQPGVTNVYADAASRFFRVNSSPQILAAMHPASQFSVPPLWLDTLQALCRRCSTSPSALCHAAAMLLDIAAGSPSSAPSTAIPSNLLAPPPLL